MRCIFCKSSSSNSKTVEHIIPESLGNTEHILQKGIVCDKCNNYFAREIERPLLETDHFVHVRFEKAIQNKKGNIPAIKGMNLHSRTIVELRRTMEGTSISAHQEKDNEIFIKSISSRKTGTLLIPVPVEPIGSIVSRFVGKVALEVLAKRFFDACGNTDEIIDKVELDELRHHVRIGGKNASWPIHTRRIYPKDFLFFEEGFGSYEIIHEFDLLFTDSSEVYFVLALFGVEYVINMGGPEIDGYLKWLQQNNSISPLYKTRD